jgi:hypothetical protein
MSLIQWVEKNGNNCTVIEFDHHIQIILKSIRETPGGPSLQMGEFRLILFVQLVALSGLIRSGLGIVEKFYPVNGRGSFTHLQLGWQKAKPKPWIVTPDEQDKFDLALEMICLETRLEYVNFSWAEGLLCESKPQRDVQDTLMYGIDLTFIKRWDGPHSPCTRKIKRFNTRHWIDPA